MMAPSATPTRISPTARAPNLSITVYVNASVPLSSGKASYSSQLAPTETTRPRRGPSLRPTSRTASPFGSMFWIGIGIRTVVPAIARPVTGNGRGGWLAISGEITLKRTCAEAVRPRLSRIW